MCIKFGWFAVGLGTAIGNSLFPFHQYNRLEIEGEREGQDAKGKEFIGLAKTREGQQPHTRGFSFH